MGTEVGLLVGVAEGMSVFVGVGTVAVGVGEGPGVGEPAGVGVSVGGTVGVSVGSAVGVSVGWLMRFMPTAVGARVGKVCAFALHPIRLKIKTRKRLVVTIRSKCFAGTIVSYMLLHFSAAHYTTLR
jgi:hypothetical protein